MIINSTPYGMYPNTDEFPVSNDTISVFDTAIDIIYNPHEIKFLKQALEAELRTLDGLYTFVSQAASA